MQKSMPRTMNVHHNLGIGAALVALAAATGVFAQRSTPAEDSDDVVKQLIVRIDADSEYGSGIILGSSADSLYIATADHVVRRGPRAAERVTVKFYGHENTPVAAKLLPNRDETLDLTVLSVSPIKGLPLEPAALPFDRLGNMDGLGRGDALYLLGQPNGLPWRMSTAPERLIGLRKGAFLEFESNLLAKGHSGGALLNSDRELIGMLKSEQSPYGDAVSIYAVARKLAEWNVPVKLALKNTRVSAGEERTCLLTPRGESHCWGYDSRFEVRPPDMRGVRLKSLSVGSHVCGVTTTGAAFCGGNNRHGQLGDGTTTSRYQPPTAVQGGLTFASISAGVGHSCGVTVDGDVYCWGLSSSGQLGSRIPDDSARPARVPTPGRFKAVSASWMYSCGLTTTGKAYCWGAVGMAEMLTHQPVTPYAPEQSFLSLSTGMQHVCGLAGDGAAWCWGFNDDGQLGNGAMSESFSDAATRVSGGLTFKLLSAGGTHACGILVNGAAYCWGGNRFGQLGNGSKTASKLPVRVSGNHAFDAISAGMNHTCGVTTGGDVYCWGSNIGAAIAETARAEELVPFRIRSAPTDERFPWRDKAP
jgi:alpha-tubulin suppressor-like RCC1 family protein